MTEGSSSRSTLCLPVFVSAVTVIALFVLVTAAQPKTASALFSTVESWITSQLGWYYIFAVSAYLLFTVYLAMSRFGTIKLGPNHSEPDYSYGSWVSMLFSAGMGIGLMFYGVAEPVLHYTNPPVDLGNAHANATQAMELTFFHWGLHAWGIYAVVSLALAYFSFRHNLPLTIRSSLYPLIGERIHGPIGHTVDTMAIFGTLFGVATSLGLGVMQINSGLNFLTGMPVSFAWQAVLIMGITAMATCSVFLGLDTGIKRLSEANVLLACLLMFLVLVMGPVVFNLTALVQNIGAYLADVVQRSFNLYAYQPDAQGWMGGWTLFYWAWWISWSPFVGMFVARISRGRTIREFVVGVLTMPVGFTFLWMTVFGDSAIHQIFTDSSSTISQAVTSDISTALFVFLEGFPIGNIMSVVAVMLVTTFFVTSADSAALVIDTLASGGETDTPVWQRVFWAIIAGMVAIALLSIGSGGLKALQTASLLSALPFSIIMLFMMYALYKALRLDSLKENAVGSMTSVANITPRALTQSWRQRLTTMLRHTRKEQALLFLEQVALPAVEEVAEEFRQQTYRVTTSTKPRYVRLEVGQGEEMNFTYEVRVRSYEMASMTYAPSKKKVDMTDDEEDRGRSPRRYYRAEVYLAEGSQEYDLIGYGKEQVIADILDQYDKHMHFLHLVR